MQGIAIKYIINTFLSNFPWLNSSGSPKIAKKFMKFFFMANITSELFPAFRKSHPQVFLGKGVLKAFSKHTGEHPCQSVISIKLQSNFIEIPLRHECFFCTFAAYYRAPLLEQLWRAASEAKLKVLFCDLLFLWYKYLW